MTTQATLSKGSKALSQDFVLSALHPDPKGLFASFQPRKDLLDWSWILTFTRKHKVAAMLAAQLERNGIFEELSPEVRSEFVGIKLQAEQRLRQAKQDLAKIHQAFLESQIPLVVFKGLIFGTEVYADAAHRPFHDLDLLVPHTSVNKAETVLTDLGYQFYCPPLTEMGFIPLGRFPRKLQDHQALSEDATKKLYERYHYHYPFVVSPGDPRLAIDLHWHVLSKDILSLDANALWRDTRCVDVDGRSFETLSAEATILYLVTKVTMKGPEGFKLLPLCDLMRILSATQLQQSLDRIKLWQMAEEWGVGRHLRFALKLVEKLFGFQGGYWVKDEQDVLSWLDVCFPLATSKGVLLKSSSNFEILRENMSSLLWDFGIFQWPRRAAKKSIRRGGTFIKKRVLTYAN